MTASAVDLVRPRFWSCPEYEVTLGPEVAAIATLAGFPPDPEQRMLLDAAFAIDPRTGKSLAFEVVVVAPRQNLKTGFEKQYALGQLFVRRERLVVWSAHEFATAQEALRDMEALISASDSLLSMVKPTYRGDVASHGAVPAIELRLVEGEAEGPRLIFKTRTAGGGRGLSGRKVILDEGYALQPGQVGALQPIMLAQPDPQIVIGSSACRPESAVLWDVVQRGRAAAEHGSDREPRMVFAEWCAPEPAEVCDDGKLCRHYRDTPGCGCDKSEVITLVHSAITRGRVLLSSVTDLRRSIPPAEYGREIMGWHDAVEVGDPAFDAARWRSEALLDPDSAIQGAVWLGVEVSQDQSWSCVAAAGRRSDGNWHVQVAETREGTSWVADAVKTMPGHENGLAISPNSPAGSLIKALNAAKIRIHPVTQAEYAQGCGSLYRKYLQGELRHLGQREMDIAVESAQWRQSGDAKVLDRRFPDVDITPLAAGVVALLRAETGKPANANRGRVVALT